MQEYLLDTHTLIWYLEGNPNLSTTAKNAIETRTNHISVSPVTYWEMAIKISLGKLRLSQSLSNIMDEANRQGFYLLSIEKQHLLVVETLPFHHKDPFDRMIIAQAMSESKTIIGKDGNFPHYDVTILW